MGMTALENSGSGGCSRMERHGGAGNVTSRAVGTNRGGICQAEGATTPLGRRQLPKEPTEPREGRGSSRSAVWAGGEEEDGAVAIKGPQDRQNLEPWWQLGGSGRDGSRAAAPCVLNPPCLVPCCHPALLRGDPAPAPGKRNREGCTAQPGAVEVPLSPCGSGAPWSSQESLGTRYLQRRRGMWL